MNKPGSTGESSCKRQENGDVSGTERPLKKARFAWQVKGKYHLKNEISETPNTSTVTSNEADKAGSSSETECDASDLVSNTEQNFEIFDYLSKQDFNTFDPVIADNDETFLKPNPNVTPEKQHYPRYFSSHENGLLNVSTSNENDILCVPLSEVLVQYFSEDQCIARWQSRQMTRACVDNALNLVLDSWVVPDNNRYVALNVTEFHNNHPGYNSVENEGILMAISAHGLQNNSSSNSNDSYNNELNSTSPTKRDDTCRSSSNSPIPSDEESFLKPLNTKKLNDSEDDISQLHMSWSSLSDDWKRTLNSSYMPFNFFPDTSTSSQNSSANEHIPVDNLEYNEDFSISNDISTSHHDFLDAAVSFAIQNKGLTSFGTDYG